MINSFLPNVLPPIVNSVSWLASQIRSGFEKFVGLFQGAKNVSENFNASNGTTINLESLDSHDKSRELNSATNISTVKSFADAQTQTDGLHSDQSSLSGSSHGSTDSTDSTAAKLTSLQWLRRLVCAVNPFAYAESTGSVAVPQRQSQADSKLRSTDISPENQQSDVIKMQLKMIAIDAMEQFKGVRIEGRNLTIDRIDRLQEHCRDADSTEPLSKQEDVFRGLQVNLKSIVEDHPEGVDKELARELATYFSQFEKGQDYIPMDQAREILSKVLEFRSALQSIQETAV